MPTLEDYYDDLFEISLDMPSTSQTTSLLSPVSINIGSESELSMSNVYNTCSKDYSSMMAESILSEDSCGLDCHFFIFATLVFLALIVSGAGLILAAFFITNFQHTHIVVPQPPVYS